MHGHYKEVCEDHGTTLAQCKYVHDFEKIIYKVKCTDPEWCKKKLLKNFNKKYPPPNPNEKII
jgi:hypothetical protein